MIFVTNPRKQEDLHDGWNTTAQGQSFYIRFIAGAGAPSEQWTSVWLDVLTDPNHEHLHEGTHLILDSLGGHHTKEMQERWKDHGIIPHRIPASAAKYLNPCDQAFHSEMRRIFLDLQHKNHLKKISNIVEAYYTVSQQAVLGSFKHAAVFEGDIDEKLARHVCQGFYPPEKREEDVDRMYTAFMEWCVKHVRDPTDALPRFRSVQALDSSLDGRQSAEFGRPSTRS